MNYFETKRHIQKRLSEENITISEKFTKKLAKKFSFSNTQNLEEKIQEIIRECKQEKQNNLEFKLIQRKIYFILKSFKIILSPNEVKFLAFKCVGKNLNTFQIKAEIKNLYFDLELSREFCDATHFQSLFHQKREARVTNH